MPERVPHHLRQFLSLVVISVVHMGQLSNDHLVRGAVQERINVVEQLRHLCTLRSMACHPMCPIPACKALHTHSVGRVRSRLQTRTLDHDAQQPHYNNDPCSALQ